MRCPPALRIVTHGDHANVAGFLDAQLAQLEGVNLDTPVHHPVGDVPTRMLGAAPHGRDYLATVAATGNLARRAGVVLLALGLGACSSHLSATPETRSSPSPMASPTLSPAPTPLPISPTVSTVPLGVAPTRHSDARPHADGRCASEQLEGLSAGGVEPFTGEHSAWINLFNVSKLSCLVSGHPHVEFHAGARALPFGVIHHGMYIEGSNAGPLPETARLVRLRPGAAAHFLIAKYRCDVGDRFVVTHLNVQLCGDDCWTTVGLPGFGPPRPGFSHCEAYNNAPDATDPGNVMEISKLAAGRVSGV